MSGVKYIIYLFALIAIISAVLPLWADEDDAVNLYNEGNAAYRNKNWDEAIEKYLAAVNSGVSSPELFYNLGCAYYRAGDIGRAILWFERARILKPRDRDINKNLAFVRRLTQDKIESIYRNTLLQWFWKVMEKISFSELWWILLIVSLAATLAISYSILQLRGYWLGITLWIIFILLAGGWYIKGSRLWETHLAIVVVPKVDVRSSPSEDGEILFTLHSGTRTGIIERRGDWYRIAIEDGHSGWADKNAVEKVIFR